MSEPKFRVGEEVFIIGAVSRSVYEATIIAIKPGNRYSICYEVTPEVGGISWRWPEHQLRKKHKPGDSFESIMNECKTGETA